MARLLPAIKQTRGILAGAFSGLSWGIDALLISFVLLALGSDTLSTTLTISMLHDGFAALWLLLLLLLRGRLKEIRIALKQRDALYCMLGALLGGPVAMTCYLLSIATAGVAVTTTVTACYPLLGAALSVLILKEKVGRRTWIGLSLCLVGIALTAYSPEEGSMGSFAWNSLLFAGLAAVGWASYLVIISVFTFWINGAEAESIQQLFTFSRPTALLLLTAFIGMSSFLAWYTAIDTIGPARALGLNVTYSVWGVILAALFLDQPPSLWVLLGSLIILLGVCYGSLSSKNENK